MPLKKPAPVAHGWVARRPRSLTLAPARRRLRGNGLGFKAKWLLRAARLKAAACRRKLDLDLTPTQ